MSHKHSDEMRRAESAEVEFRKSADQIHESMLVEIRSDGFMQAVEESNPGLVLRKPESVPTG